MDDLNFIRREEDIGHIVLVKNVAILKRSPLLEDAIHDRHRSFKEFLILVIGDDADDGRRIN